jgi:eukaryotic-like serine/threonine-protein kinase
MVAAGMGAAEADGGVDVADPEATIDGAEPRQDPARLLPVEVVAVVRDYPELLEVERRHYAVVRELARGGMGRVLEARDLRLGRQVAIKELLPKNRDIARRFEREARITARLQHPSIIHVYEAGVWQGGEPFYAMPVVPGQSLDKLVAEKHTLAERLALLPRVIAVADALAYAHDKNVIHRDLKPANVLVGDFGETVVIDWGLAKDLGAQTDPKESMTLPLRATGEETVSGSVVGTPAYMPPEQARGGDAVDQRADVYSLGALLYKVLTGHAPYQGATANEVIAQVKARPPVPLGEREPDTPPDLLAIVRKAMAREPSERYETASQLAKDLERFQTGQLVGAHRYTAGQLVRRWLRRHRIAVSVAVAAAISLAIVGAISVRNVVEARDRAEARRVALLEERGRSELAAGHAGEALAYLVGAAHAGYDASLGFALAEAIRPFDAEIAQLTRAPGHVVVGTSPDGTHIVTVTGGGVELWTPSGKPVRALGVLPKPSVVAFDLTSTRVAVGTDDGEVEVWTLDGTIVAKLAAHTGPVLDLAFSIDGRLATAGADGDVHVWNLHDGTHKDAQCKQADDTRVATSTHKPAVLTVRFDELGLFAAYGADDDSACIWNTFTGLEFTPLRGHRGAITAIRWSPDDSWVATASADGTARIWSPIYGKTIVKPLQHDQPVAALEVSPDGSRIVTGDTAGQVAIWTVPTRLPSGDDGDDIADHDAPLRLAPHGGRIVTVAFSADGELVATGAEDWQATVSLAHTGQTFATFEHADTVSSVAFADGGRKLVTGSRDGTSRIWDVDRIKPRVYSFDSPVKGLAVSSRGVVAATRADSVVEIVEPKRDSLTGPLYGSVFAAAFTPDGSTLITGGEDGYLIAWSMSSREAPVRLEHAEAPVRVMVASPDGQHVATAGGGAQLWSLATRKAITLPTGDEKVLALAYTPSGDLLAGGTKSGALILWNASGAVIARRALHIPIIALAFSNDGKKLAVGSVAAARVFAVDDLSIATTPRTSIEGARGEIRATVFACGGQCLVTANDLGTVDIWDADTGKPLETHDVHAGAVTGLALSPDGKKVWVATEGKTVTDWNVEVETRGAAALDRFMRAHVPWRLGTDDVAVRREGDQDDQHRPDRK